MATCLLLRFDAPLVSFGGPAVDERRYAAEFPGTSLLTGLLGNALGWEHRDFDRLQRLQGRLRHATRRDRAGRVLREYQTVDLGQPHMRANEVGWTTRGRVEVRGGGSAKTMTHQGWRDFRQDSVHTTAVTLEPAAEEPTIDALGEALARPARPLFIGRKCCLPAAPILLGRCEAADVEEALRRAPRLGAKREDPPPWTAWWAPGGTQAPEGAEELPTWDERDWANQIHGGHRVVVRGLLHPEGVNHER